ncbi:glycosyltransferase [Metabacillus indicus]|uniref:glycosyltransferase n=1 Tax=Metabacillus indicus TaxID=246786 RepID=UPI00249170A2|nr:glycosyltransferase [Metabacillus indicus]
MNILMLLYKDIPYDARVKREALALAEAGHSVYLACVREFPEPDPFLHKNIHLKRLPISVKSMKAAMSGANSGQTPKRSGLKRAVVRAARLPLVKILKDYMAYYEFYKKVKSKVGDLKIDAVHCHDLNTLWQGSMLAKDFSAKLIYDAHEIFNEMAGRNGLDRFTGYKMEKHLFQKIDRLVTVNLYLRDYLFERNGEKPCVLIQNIPLFSEDMLAGNKAIDWNYTFGEDDTVLLYQGGFSPYRGLDLIVKTVAELPESFKLVMIGSGILKEELKSLAESLGVSDRVFFHDQVPSEDLFYYTQKADIGLVMYEKVSKNNYYSTPNKMFEYLQAGVPAVSSNHPGKSVVIDEYKTGVLAEETTEGIKAGIMEVKNNYEYYRQNCLQARSVLTWEAESRKLAEMYENL